MQISMFAKSKRLVFTVSGKNDRLANILVNTGIIGRSLITEFFVHEYGDEKTVIVKSYCDFKDAYDEAFSFCKVRKPKSIVF